MDLLLPFPGPDRDHERAVEKPDGAGVCNNTATGGSPATPDQRNECKSPKRWRGACVEMRAPAASAGKAGQSVRQWQRPRAS
jgi:hypothetical protein